MNTMDKLEADVKAYQSRARAADLAWAIQDLRFRSPQAKADFQVILLAGAKRKNEMQLTGPSGEALTEFAQSEYARFPELHAPKQEEPTVVAVPAAEGSVKKQFDMNDINVNMSEADTKNAWKAIQRALKI